MLPFRLKPVFKDYLWGGARLTGLYEKFYGADHPEIIAESWELASHKDGDNVILDGPCKNVTLSNAVKRFPEIVSPDFNSYSEDFPLMVKLIDAKLFLSVQVHPDNDYALMFEHSKGKSEAWHILAHEEGAYLYLGFEQDITREEFEHAINNNTLMQLLHKVYVHDGDTLFIPPGTIHAIGAGILLAEIQENSNITYRVYDYGRRGSDGKTRELHITKALDVTSTCVVNTEPPGKSGNILIRSDKFCVEKLRVENFCRCEKDSEGFKFLLCIDGRVNFCCDNTCFEISEGENIFVPANCEKSFTIEGNGEFLVTSQ